MKLNAAFDRTNSSRCSKNNFIACDNNQPKVRASFELDCTVETSESWYPLLLLASGTIPLTKFECRELNNLFPRCPRGFKALGQLWRRESRVSNSRNFNKNKELKLQNKQVIIDYIGYINITFGDNLSGFLIFFAFPLLSSFECFVNNFLNLYLKLVQINSCAPSHSFFFHAIRFQNGFGSSSADMIETTTLGARLKFQGLRQKDSWISE